MAISLGSLFVDLKVNLGEFVSGMTKGQASMKSFGKEIQTGLTQAGALFAPLGEMGQKLAGTLDVLGKSAGTAFTQLSRGQMLAAGIGTLGVAATAAAGGIFALAMKSADLGAKVYDASTTTGIAAGQLSGLMAIAKETGGDFDQMTVSLARAGVSLHNAISNPASAAARALTADLGPAFSLAAEKSKSMGDALRDTLKHIYDLHDAGTREAALQILLQRGWTQNGAALEAWARSADAGAAAAKGMGRYFSDDQAKQAKTLKVEIASLSAKAEGLGLALGRRAIPYVLAFANAIVESIPYVKALIEGMIAVGAAATGQLYKAEIWAEKAGETWKGAPKWIADFRAQVAALTAAAGSGGTGDTPPGGTFKAHADALAELIARQRDELDALDSNNNARREMELEYNHTITAIEKALAAHGSEREAIEAEGLALDVYNRKLDLYNEKILASGKNVIPPLPWLQGPLAAPELSLPSLPAGLLSGATPPTQTLAQLAKLGSQGENTTAVMRTLAKVAELDDDNFSKLAQAFPNLTENMLAADPAAMKLLNTLLKMQKAGISGVVDSFKELGDQIILTGDELGKHLADAFGHALDSVEDQLAKLAITGKANFKKIGEGLEESIAKAGIQRGISSLMGMTGLGHIFGGGKRDGSTPQASLYVTPTSAGSFGALTAGGGQGAGKLAELPIGDLAKSNQDTSQQQTAELSNAFGTMFQSLSGELGGLFKGLGSIFGKIFGGFLQGGGNVSPGHAYVVGERHPEWFVPKMAGQVQPSMAMHAMRPLTYSPTFHINTPDADSFRRAHSAIVADGYRQMALVHARNG
jgi:hypothetical protein